MCFQFSHAETNPCWHSLSVLLHPGKAAQTSVELRVATRRVLECRSICATSQWLCSQWRLCFPVVSGRGKLLWGFKKTPTMTTKTCISFLWAIRVLCCYLLTLHRNLTTPSGRLMPINTILLLSRISRATNTRILQEPLITLSHTLKKIKVHLTRIKNLISGLFITNDHTCAVQQLYINLYTLD